MYNMGTILFKLALEMGKDVQIFCCCLICNTILADSSYYKGEAFAFKTKYFFDIQFRHLKAESYLLKNTW